MRRSFNASVAAVLVGAMFSLPLVACGADNTITLRDVDGFFDVHTSAQAAYLAGDYKNVPANGVEELSRPQPLRLSWNAEGSADFTVELARDADFDDCVTYRTKKPYLDVYNLYVGTVYGWRVTARFSGGETVTSDTSFFYTEETAPRNMYVDGITNVRDLGGWKINGSDERVKQGMIYRCGRLNKSRQPEIEIEITERGVLTMLGEMGIKSEVDLRTPDKNGPETGGITSSPLGDGVTYFVVPLNWEQLINEKASIVRMFEILADINNYPLIFHCDIGTDRTGMFAFLINGLMGVAEEDLYRDYLFSNFANIGDKRSLSNITGANGYVTKIKAHKGLLLKDKIRNYLVEVVGVDESDIDAMCEILSDN
ncbi:MAG: tyrosine-protein phosphatase [Clostridiales bacterium]|nr:tyrosine-protein phosphatase [Clostridiales bacterium]